MTSIREHENAQLTKNELNVEEKEPLNVGSIWIFHSKCAVQIDGEL